MIQRSKEPIRHAKKEKAQGFKYDFTPSELKTLLPHTASPAAVSACPVLLFFAHGTDSPRFLPAHGPHQSAYGFARQGRAGDHAIIKSRFFTQCLIMASDTLI
ncbi:MAG: hypothetical protein LUE23_01870 [Lachnospiraceae bacterium]|nr:hypothetical protein [Lachnospiraceae bacterium]